MSDRYKFRAQTCVLSRPRKFLCHLLPATVAMLIGAFGIMVIDRADPVVVTFGEIIPPTVEPGQTVAFHYKSIKTADYGGKVVRWIVDAKGVVYHLTDSGTVGDKLPFQIEGEVTKTFPIPCGISTGPATYHSEAQLYKYWNVVQWVWPVKRHINFPFVVKQAIHNTACGFYANGAPGAPGATGATGAKGDKGDTGERGANAPIGK